MEEIVEKLVDIVAFIHQQILEVFGINGDMEEEAGLHTQEGGQHASANSHHQPSKSRLSSEKRVHILMKLLQTTNGGQLKRGAMKEVAAKFNVSIRTTSRIWNTAKQRVSAIQRPNLSIKYHNSGAKRVVIDPTAIAKINMGDRSCIRDLASKLGISKSATHRLIKRGTIRPYTNALKLGLNEANKKSRLAWILSLLQGGTPKTKRKYFPMFDFVHIDEKWFQLNKKSQRVYLAQHERGKYRSASSTKFIPKVMFTVAVARPRFDSEEQCTFNGKIGIFSFTYQEPAKRK